MSNLCYNLSWLRETRVANVDRYWNVRRNVVYIKMGGAIRATPAQQTASFPHQWWIVQICGNYSIQVSIQGVMMAGFLTLVVTTMMLLLHTYGHRDTGNVVSWMDSRKSADVHIIGSFGQSAGVTSPHLHASSDRICTNRHGDTRYRVSCDADKAPPSPLPQDATVFEFDE